MPGGNPPKPPAPQSTLSGPSHHRTTRWESSASAAAAASKSKPSPDTNNRVPNNKPPTTKPRPRPENPSPRPENPNLIPGPRPFLPRPENPSPRPPENPNSIPGPRPFFPFNDPPPPPSYGFHMLDRRSIVLADGSVRSYFALPPDYENFTYMPRPGPPAFRPEFRPDRPPIPMSPEFFRPDARAQNPDYWNPGRDNSLKRKFGEHEREPRDDGFERQRQQLLQYGNANGPGTSAGYNLGRGEEMRVPKNMRILEGNPSKLKHSEVDQNALKKAFLHFVKLIFENTNQKKTYLVDGKQGPLSCLACNRSSKDFADTHSLIMHAYDADSANSIVDHLAFHKALCILMGWNFLVAPDNSKAYQNLSAADAERNQDDLIMWPPSVLIHNTITGKGRDGRMEGIGNRAMDSILRDLGFGSGKSMSMYSREGHLGIHTVKFSADESGIKEALRLGDYFERQKVGRKAWGQVQGGKDNENDPNIMRVDPVTGERRRVFYGHLATVADLDKVTFEIKKKVSVVSIREFNLSR